MPDVPFAVRVLVLLLLMAVGAAVDVRRNGRAATRPREYGLILAGGAIGAAFAATWDSMTSRVSPEYFVYGKGIDAGPGFTWGVLELALQAGSFAGLVVLGALLVATQPGPARRALAPREALGLGLVPLGCALLAAPLGAALARALDPLGLAREMKGVISPEAVRRFVLVWGSHAGLYAGALVGLVVVVVAARRRTSIVSPHPMGGPDTRCIDPEAGTGFTPGSGKPTVTTV